MKRFLSAAIVIVLPLLGACHYRSRAWLAQHANDDKLPTKVVADTQPTVRLEGEPKQAEAKQEQPKQGEPKLHAWSRASALTPMSRSSIGSSDGRTVGMLLMTNDVNLSFAKIAYAGASSDDVKNFARRMLTDHTQIILTIRSLVATQDMTPSEDNAGRDLRDFATLQRDSLRALTGRAFDSTYVAMELDRHRAMLSMIDDVLLPRARSTELREMLASTRPIIAAHVAHAEQLQATLARR
jgi:putative membrane protein